MVKIVGNFEVNDWAHWKNGFDNHAEDHVLESKVNVTNLV
jgi:hypothetical protein